MVACAEAEYPAGLGHIVLCITMHAMQFSLVRYYWQVDNAITAISDAI